MEEYLKKVKDAISYCLNTWIPSGQKMEDNQLEIMVEEIFADQRFSIGKDCEFRLHCSHDGTEEYLYNEEKFEALDPASKELAYNLNFLGLLIHNPYDPESFSMKFYNDFKAKYGFN